MNIKLISLFITAVIGISGIFYVINLIESNAENKKELKTLRINYDRLKTIQKANERALVKRQTAYNEARYKHSTEVKKLEKALADAKAIDDCVDRDLPPAVREQLRNNNSTN